MSWPEAVVDVVGKLAGAAMVIVLLVGWPFSRSRECEHREEKSEGP